MGQCGCGDMNIIKTYKLGKYWVAVDYYRGCRDCFNGPGYSLHVMTPREAHGWDIQEPTERIEPEKGEHSQIVELLFGFIGLEEIIQATNKYEKKNGEFKVQFDPKNPNECWDSLADFLRDEGQEIFEMALKEMKMPVHFKR